MGQRGILFATLAALALGGCTGAAPGSSSNGSSCVDTMGMGMCSSSSSGSNPVTATAVGITDYAFQYHDSGITLSADKAVTFVNNGAVLHNVSIHDGSTGAIIANHDIQPNEYWVFAPPHMGDFHAFCSYHWQAHPDMQLMMHVTAAT
jgi:plastocyanin